MNLIIIATLFIALGFILLAHLLRSVSYKRLSHIFRSRLGSGSKLSAFPSINVDSSTENYAEALRLGEKLFPHSPFRITLFPGEWLILPPHHIEEIRAFPESVLSLQQASYDFFMGRFTGVANYSHSVGKFLRSGHSSRIIDLAWREIEEETAQILTRSLPHSTEWTAVQMLPLAFNAILVISQRIFVGEPLCRDPEWLRNIIQFTRCAWQSMPRLWKCNSLTRPWAAWRHPSITALGHAHQKTKDLLRGMLARRIDDMNRPEQQYPPNIIQFMLEATKETGEGLSVDYQLDVIRGLCRATLVTTGNALFAVCHELASRPEYQDPLRREISNMKDTSLTRSNIAKLTMLDSFIRETQRFSPMMLIGTHRKVMKKTILSDGTTLPQGAYIGTDTRRCSFTQSRIDNAMDFDGFRWHNLRQAGSKDAGQSTTTSADCLAYGIGSQACPGRFLAAHMLKVATINILQRYQLRVSKGAEGHLRGITHGILIAANDAIEIDFRKLN